MQAHLDGVLADRLDVLLGQVHGALVEVRAAGLLDRADDVGSGEQRDGLLDGQAVLSSLA